MINKSNLTWYSIAALLLVIFLFFTPLTIYNSLGIWLALIESLIVSFFVFMGIMGFKTFSDIFYIKDNDKKLQESEVVYVPMTCWVVVTIIIFYTLDIRLDNEIDKNGVYTKAVIVDGQRTVSKSIRRKTETNKLTIRFKSEDGKSRTYDTKISQEIFKSVSKGLEVEIKYLPEHPELFKIMVGTENLTKFKDISNRDLSFSDLEKLQELNREDILNYVNSISEGWILTTEENGDVYSNELKDEMVAVSNEGKIIFKGNGVSQPDVFIPKDRVLNKSTSTESNKNGYTVLKLTTYELDSMEIVHVFAIKNTSIESSLILSKK